MSAKPEWFDVAAEVAEYCRVLGLAEIPIVKWRQSKYAGVRGWAHWSRKPALVSMTVGPAGATNAFTRRAQILWFLLHELAHIATPGQHHNHLFRRVLANAGRDIWGFELPQHPERGDKKNTAYAMDAIAIDWLAVMLETHILRKPVGWVDIQS